jgi:orotate phosphoribosyltransferase
LKEIFLNLIDPITSIVTEKQEILASDLFEVGAIKFGAFKLKLHEKVPDAPLSPLYIDLRILRSFPKVLRNTIEVFKELVAGLKFDLLADIPTAATPFVAILSYEMGIPMISPRKDEKTHGLSRRIDGVFQTGQRVLLLDDLITKADSKFEAIQVLQENGLHVQDVLVLVDREQGGARQLEEAGYRLHAVFKLKDLLRYYLTKGKLEPARYEEIMQYLAMST